MIIIHIQYILSRQARMHISKNRLKLIQAKSFHVSYLHRDFHKWNSRIDIPQIGNA